VEVERTSSTSSKRARRRVAIKGEAGRDRKERHNWLSCCFSSYRWVARLAWDKALKLDETSTKGEVLFQVSENSQWVSSQRGWLEYRLRTEEVRCGRYHYIPFLFIASVVATTAGWHYISSAVQRKPEFPRLRTVHVSRKPSRFLTNMHSSIFKQIYTTTTIIGEWRRCYMLLAQCCCGYFVSKNISAGYPPPWF
jgi:hypothetical protein